VSTGSDDWKPEPVKLDEPPQPIGLDESSLVEVALLQRLDVWAASWELESAVADFEQQRRRVIPSLTLGLSGERFERRAMPVATYRRTRARASLRNGRLSSPEIQSRAERRKERRQEIDFVLGPSIDFPLPIFDQNQAQIAKAQFRARELQQRYEEVEQRVVEEFDRRLLNVASPKQSAIVSRYPGAAARGEPGAVQTSYQSGRESILTVLLAQESLIRTRLAYAAAVRDLPLARPISNGNWQDSYPSRS